MQSLGSTDRFPPVHHKLILNLGASPRCRSCAIDSWCLPGHRVIAASPFHGHSGSNQSVRITPNDLQHKKLPLRAHQAAVGDPVTWADRVAQRRTSVLKLFAIGIILVVWRGREWQSRLIDKTATLDTLAIVENSGVRQIFPVEL